MISIRRSFTIKLCLCVLLGYVYYILSKQNGFGWIRIHGTNKIMFSNSSAELPASKTSHRIKQQTVQEMIIAVVACGERLQETLTMIKSCLLFSPKSPLKFIVIADDDLILDFKEKLTEWQQTLNGSFRFEVLKLKFPEKDADEWRKLFKPCASQRLFLPTLLPNIDSLIYLDTDTLFLSPVESLWKHFSEFNSSQMAGLALEHDDPNVSWYSRFAKHPYYGRLGVNSGVMLMNLTRMRSFHWGEYVASVYHRWRTQLTWGDQDIINIIFHYHSERLLLLNCDANYRPDQCAYGSACPTASKEGARVLHGSRSAFHSSRQPAFSAVHKAARNYQLGTNPSKYFLAPLLAYLQSATESNCGKIPDAFTKIPRQLFEKEYDENMP